MSLKRKKTFVWILAGIFLITQMLLASPSFAQDTGTSRLSGADRYKTAVAVSQKGWKTADYAVLARGDNFADALCAGPLALKYGGPILLTQPSSLNSDTLAELKRLGVKHLFIAGGTGAISQSVEDALKTGGITDIERIYGADRYETSVKIAEKMGDSTKVVLATGSDFPDALSISVIASKLGMPILLTGKDNLPKSIEQYVDKHSSISQTYLVGGTSVLSVGLEDKVPGATRLAGGSRYETNLAIIKAFESELNFENIYIAIGGGPKGNEFADALTGAVLAAKNSSPLVLANKVLAANTSDYLKAKIELGSKVVGLGGQSVVPSSLLTTILSYKELIAVSEKYSVAGTYGPETGSATISGNVTISAPDVTLRNTIIEGDLLLAQSIGDGDVTLSGVTVKGKTIVNGGGPNSIIMYNFNGVTVIVDVPEGSNVRLVAQGNTSINNVTMESDGRLEEDGLTGTGFINVAIPAGAQVTLDGNFAEVSVEASGANVTVTSGTISTMTVTETATGADINLATGSTVTTLNAQAESTNITGQGQITTANISGKNVAIEQTPITTTVAPDITANVGGQTQSGTNTNPLPPPGGGGGGGGGSDTVLVTGISVTGANGATNVENGQTLQMSATVTPTNATNANVTWSVTAGSGTATISASGLLTATGIGTVTVKASAADASGITGTRLITINSAGSFTPGEGGSMPAFTPFTETANIIPGLYVAKNHRENNFFGGGTSAVVELEFPAPSVYGATSYTLQYSADGGSNWQNYQSSGADLITSSNTQDNFSLTSPGGDYQYRLLVNGGTKNGYTSNVVEVPLSGVNTWYQGWSLDESMSINNIMVPYVGRGLEASFTVQKLADYSAVNGTLTYQWYRVNPKTFEMTPIAGATGLRYITTEADAGYYFIIRATGDGVNAGGYAQIFTQNETVFPNKATISNIANNGFTLNLYKAVDNLTASDLLLEDNTSANIPITAVTPGANNAIYNITANMPVGSDPIRLTNNSPFWRIVSSVGGPGHMMMEGIDIILPTHLVSYDGNGSTGGSTPTDGREYAENDTVTVLGNTRNLVKTGYTFAGWDTVSDGSGSDRAAGSTFAMGTANITLYAQWTANNYTVTFDKNGGDSEANPATKTATHGGNVGSLPTAPTKAGNTFTSWNTAANGSGNGFDATTPVTGNITVYAQWTANTYTVTFDKNGGDGEANPATKTATHGGTVGSLPTAPSKTGNTFTSWNTAANGSGTGFDATTLVTGNITVYAQWTANTYTVTFDKNGGDSEANPATKTATHGGNVGSLPTAPTKAGNTFTSWNTAANGSGTGFDATTPVTGNITVYAQWTANNYTVTFDKNGGDSEANPATKTATHGGNVGSLPTAPTKAGNTFTSWNTAANGSGTGFDATTPVTGNITVYAQWTANTYTVTFDKNGGDSEANPATKTATHGGNVGSLPTAPTKAGNTFTSWNTAANGSGTGFDATTPVTGNITVYAQWLSNVTEVTSKDAGENNPHYSITTHNLSLIPANNPIAAGSTAITTTTTVSTFLGNINIPATAQYKIANASTIAGDFSTLVFADIQAKAEGDNLAIDDLLLVKAPDGTLRGYHITVIVADVTAPLVDLTKFSAIDNANPTQDQLVGAAGAIGELGAAVKAYLWTDANTNGIVEPAELGTAINLGSSAASGAVAPTDIGDLPPGTYKYLITATDAALNESIKDATAVKTITLSNFAVDLNQVTVALTNNSADDSGIDACKDADGNYHMVYERSGNIYYKKVQPTQLSLENLLGAGSGPSIAVDSSGLPHVSYLASGDIVYNTSSDGSTWSQAIIDANNCTWADLAVGGPDNVAHIVYTDNVDGDSYSEILYTHNTAGSFAPSATLCDGWYDSGSGDYYTNPSIAVDAAGKYHISLEHQGWGGRASWSSKNIQYISNNGAGLSLGSSGYDWNGGVQTGHQGIATNGLAVALTYTAAGTLYIAQPSGGTLATSSMDTGVEGYSAVDISADSKIGLAYKKGGNAVFHIIGGVPTVLDNSIADSPVSIMLADSGRILYDKTDGQDNEVFVTRFSTQVPTAVAATAAFSDSDINSGELGGQITWTAAADESTITYYAAFFLNGDGSMGSQIGTDVAKGGIYSITVAPNTGIPAGTTKIAVFSKNMAGLNASGKEIVISDTADVTAPILSATSVSDIEQTSAKLNFTSDEAGTYFYVVYLAADDAPNAQTIEAQGAAVTKGTGAVMAAANTINLQDLAQGTAYKVYWIVKDEASNISNVASLAITTLSPTYTVTFDKNGGDSEANPTTKTASHGGNVGSLPTAPSRTGYTFTSWNTLANGSGTGFDATTPVTGNITVYAQWTADAGGDGFTPGEGGSMPAFTPFTETANVIPGLYVAKNHRENNFFGGGTSTVVELEFPAPSVYGATSYTLQYSADGGSNWQNYQSSGADLITNSNTQDNFSLTSPGGDYQYRLLVNGGAKDGYTSNVVEAPLSGVETWFQGWSLDESMSINNVMMPYVGRGLDASFTVQKLADYSAVNGALAYQWYRVNPKTFAMTAIPGATELRYITTEADAGYNLMIRATGDGVNAGGYAQIFSQGETVFPNQATVSNITNTGFTLNLYKTVDNLTASDLLLEDNTSASIPITAVTPGANNAIYNITSNMPVGSDPIRLTNNSPFWRIVSSVGGLGHMMMEGIDIILPTHLVNYDGNESSEGSVPIDVREYAENDTVTVLGNTGNLVKTGYNFAGWNTASDGSGSDRAAGSTFAMGTANVTLYAKWTANTYTITFDKNGGDSEANPTTKTATHGGNVGSLPTAPSKTGDDFAGWNTKADGTGNSFDETTLVTGSITVYAQWGSNPPQILSVGLANMGGTPVLAAGDTLLFVFNVDTNQPAVGSKGEIDQLIDFGTKSFGANYSAQWLSASSLLLTVTEATGGTLAVGDTVTIKASGNLKTADGLSSPSTSSFLITVGAGGGGGGGGEPVSISALSSADMLIRQGSIVMGYTFKNGDQVVTYDQAISDTYALDLENSSVTLSRFDGSDYTQVGNTVKFSALTITNSNVVGESAKVSFPDFGTLLAQFGLNFSNPTNIPTHVKVIVQSKTAIGDQGIDNPWGPIDSGWVSINSELISPIDVEKSTATVTGGNKTAGTVFPVSITLKDNTNLSLPNGNYAVQVLSGEATIGGGETAFTDGTASINALFSAPGTYTVTIKVNNVTIESIENVVAVASPIFISATPTPDGTKFWLTFDKAMADPSGKQAQFTIMVDNINNPITSAGLKADDNSTIELTLTTSLTGGENYAIAYTQGDVTAADAGILRTFSWTDGIDVTLQKILAEDERIIFSIFKTVGGLDSDIQGLVIGDFTLINNYGTPEAAGVGGIQLYKDPLGGTFEFEVIPPAGQTFAYGPYRLIFSKDGYLTKYLDFVILP